MKGNVSKSTLKQIETEYLCGWCHIHMWARCKGDKT